MHSAPCRAASVLICVTLEACGGDPGGYNLEPELVSVQLNPVQRLRADDLLGAAGLQTGEAFLHTERW